MTYRRLTAAGAALAQWLKRIWNWFVKNQRWLWEDFPRLILGALSRSCGNDTSIKRQRSNTKKYSKDQICKYGSRNMQCQLLVIILMMMKAVKILIQFNRYVLSFLCQKQLSTTYHFFPQIPWACQKYILTVLLDVPLRSPTNSRLLFLDKDKCKYDRKSN